MHTDFNHVSVRVSRILVVWLFLGVPAALVLGTCCPAALSDTGSIVGDGKVVVLEPQKWIGKQFPLIGYIDIGHQLEEGSWTVLLFHHDCPKCQEALSYLRQLARESVLREPLRLALAELPPYDPAVRDASSDDVPYVGGKLNDSKNWFVEAPLILSLRNGKVVGVMRYEDVMIFTEQIAGSI